ncbi:hypothetical protein VII00023_17404 [Vibrio ichthyoenteri ATCC 700023]|uniref:Uncharacterized protein n=1 Tax=Vibrio ichthyoenteri ATCC 700023 TaxID=870968 RepID=F9S694_9VIBR|nr:hypothetical protein [Vibrio ichthyoenteri]EGU33932.1 hypothetical protein VII00023_17404 [Vibrio ichthyoenteri ATCC 700023]
MKDKVKKYWPINKTTLEVLSMCKAEYRGGLYHIPKDALESEPLPPKQGFAVVAVLDESGKAIDSEYIEDHQGTMIYDESDCTKSEMVSELGPIKEGFTPDKPLTEFDERTNGVWVTNETNKYLHDYASTDAKREASYRQLTDKLEIEYARKVRQGKTEEALILSERINELESQIKENNPHPTPPQA